MASQNAEAYLVEKLISSKGYKTNTEYEALKYRLVSRDDKRAPGPWLRKTLVEEYLHTYKIENRADLLAKVKDLTAATIQSFYLKMPFSKLPQASNDDTVLLTENFYYQGGPTTAFDRCIGFNDACADMCERLKIIHELWVSLFVSIKQLRTDRTLSMGDVLAKACAPSVQNPFQKQQELALILSRIYRAKFLLEEESEERREVEALVLLLKNDFPILFADLSQGCELVFSSRREFASYYLKKNIREMLLHTSIASGWLALRVMYFITYRDQIDTEMVVTDLALYSLIQTRSNYTRMAKWFDVAFLLLQSGRPSLVTLTGHQASFLSVLPDLYLFFISAHFLLHLVYIDSALAARLLPLNTIILVLSYASLHHEYRLLRGTDFQHFALASYTSHLQQYAEPLAYWIFPSRNTNSSSSSTQHQLANVCTSTASQIDWSTPREAKSLHGIGEFSYAYMMHRVNYQNAKTLLQTAGDRLLSRMVASLDYTWVFRQFHLWIQMRNDNELNIRSMNANQVQLARQSMLYDGQVSAHVFDYEQIPEYIQPAQIAALFVAIKPLWIHLFSRILSHSTVVNAPFINFGFQNDNEQMHAHQVTLFKIGTNIANTMLGEVNSTVLKWVRAVPQGNLDFLTTSFANQGVYVHVPNREIWLQGSLEHFVAAVNVSESLITSLSDAQLASLEVSIEAFAADMDMHFGKISRTLHLPATQNRHADSLGLHVLPSVLFSLLYKDVTVNNSFYTLPARLHSAQTSPVFTNGAHIAMQKAYTVAMLNLKDPQMKILLQSIHQRILSDSEHDLHARMEMLWKFSPAFFLGRSLDMSSERLNEAALAMAIHLNPMPYRQAFQAMSPRVSSLQGLLAMNAAEKKQLGMYLIEVFKGNHLFEFMESDTIDFLHARVRATYAAVHAVSPYFTPYNFIKNFDTRLIAKQPQLFIMILIQFMGQYALLLFAEDFSSIGVLAKRQIGTYRVQTLEKIKEAVQSARSDMGINAGQMKEFLFYIFHYFNFYHDEPVNLFQYNFSSPFFEIQQRWSAILPDFHVLLNTTFLNSLGDKTKIPFDNFQLSQLYTVYEILVNITNEVYSITL